MVGTGTREQAGERTATKMSARTTEVALARTDSARRDRGIGAALVRRSGATLREGDYFFVAAAAASSFLMTSVVMSRPGSAQTTPESMLLNTMWRFLAAETSDSTGRSLRWNSSCSSF